MVFINRSLLSRRLIAFMGPSGSGKDTLMVKSRDILLSEGLNVHIVERWITRSHDETEQFKSVSSVDFESFKSKNFFALDWSVYGNQYGVPWSEIDPFLEKGFVVLVNISREMVTKLKDLYPHSRLVLIEANPRLAEERIKLRKREQGEMLEARIHRLQQSISLPFIPDLIIKNVGKINSILYVLVEFIKMISY